MNRYVNKGSIGCAMGAAIMMGSAFLALVIFIKCFRYAYGQPDFTLSEYISALFYWRALIWYLLTGIIFGLGLWLFINAIITIVRDFFEV